MYDIYLGCAIIGGTITVCQFLLSLIGLAHHEFGLASAHDGHVGHTGHHSHGHTHDGQHAFLKLLSLRSILAAITFFGLTGIAANKSAWTAPLTFLAAGIVGLVALYVAGAIMNFFTNLDSDGTVQIEQALGEHGRVYLTVPANKGGTGKITLTIQNRTMEYLAVTSAGEIPTGAKILVIDIVNPETVEVAPDTETDTNTDTELDARI